MKFDANLFVYQLINFLIFWAVIHFALMKILGVIKQRNQQIADDLAAAKTEREQAEQTRKDWDARISTAEVEAGKIVTQAGKEAEEFRTREMTRVKAEMENVVSRAKEEIQSSRSSVIKELRKDMADIAASIATRFLKERIDQARAEKMVDELVKEKERVH